MIPRHRYCVITVLPREQSIIVLRKYMGSIGSIGYLKAKVDAVGPEVTDVKVGDTVLVGRFCGLDIESDNDVRCVRDSEIQAVIED